MYKKLFDLAQENGMNNFQIMITSVEGLEFEVYNDKIDKFRQANVEEYLVSAVYNEKKVNITTEYLDESIISLLKEKADYLEITTDLERDELENIREKKEYKLEDSKEIVDRILKLDLLRTKVAELKEVHSEYEEKIIKRRLITDKNELYDVKKDKVFVVEIFVKDESKSSSSYRIENAIGDVDINVEKITNEVLENAMDKLHYKEVENGIYKVILSGRVMGEILEKFIGLFSAENIQKQTSLLVDKLGKKVFSDKITIVEDPCNSELFGKRLFDDTGIKTCYKEVVKDGVFVQELYDKKTADIDKVKTTGNDYGMISTRNLYIKSGDRSLDDMIRNLDRGILIDSVSGIHSGINSTNGDISLQAEGYYIENGEKKYASKLFVLSTNIMELLNHVIEISDSLDLTGVTVSSPDLLFDGIKIAK